jgi:rhamnosyltransferase
VLLAAYNGEKFIGEQIESILRQTLVDLRLVIRDDGSSDSTVPIIRRFAEADARIVLITAETASGSAAQNFFSLMRTVQVGDFDFVALSDQDDIWNNDKLRQAADKLAGSQASGYSSAVTAVWPTGRERILRQNTSETESDFLFEGAGQGCTFVLKGDFYEKLRSFLIEYVRLTPDIRFHDWTVYALARNWNLRWAFDQTPTMTYRQHAGNDTGARLSILGVIRRLSRIREGWYLAQLQAIATICAAAGAGSFVDRWREMLLEPRSWSRRLRIVGFCLRGGRRRVSDNVVLVIAALAGWI